MTDTTPSAAFTGDEDLIRRMIVNLIDNAVRHAPSGSTVHVDLDTTDTGYAIAIRDHGAGIPVEIRPHIFERFYRREAASRFGGHDGAGLGLALARWIANVHGGDVVTGAVVSVWFNVRDLLTVPGRRAPAALEPAG